MGYSNYREATTLSALAYRRSITESGQGGLSGDALDNAIDSIVVDQPRFSAEYAADIVMNYSLHSAWSFEDSGLQAALFREEGTDRYVLAITGTEFGSDTYSDLIVGGGGGIVGNGFAIDQAIDLQQVLQDIIDDPAVSSIDVVGHSLGGHLALMSEALQPDLVGQVTTVNGAGIGIDVLTFDALHPLVGFPGRIALGQLGLDVGLLDSRISAGNVIEYSVHGDPVSGFPGLTNFGTQIEVETGGSSQLAFDPLFGPHGIAEVMVAAHFTDLIMNLDANASIGSVNQIIANASPVNFQSLGVALG